MITLLRAPDSRHGPVTASMSRSTTRRSPDLSAPMLMTMSISRAPSKSARRVSYCLTSGVVAPSGNPTTEQTFTADPCRSRAQLATQVGFTHTLAKWYSAASRHNFSTSLREASGLSSVWSIIAATSPGPPPEACRPSREAPASITLRSRSGQHSNSTE